MTDKEAKAIVSCNTKDQDTITKEDLFKNFDFKKKNCFFITLNYEQDEDIEISKNILLKKLNNIMKYLTSLKYIYILSSLETNEKEYYHVHIFVQFDSPHKLAISKMEGANIQIMKSSVNKCIDYVKKNGVILKELGYPNYITGNPSIKDIALTRHSDIIKNMSDYRYYKVIKSIKKDNQPSINSKKNIYIIKELTYELLNNQFKNYQYFNIKNGKICHWYYNLIIKQKYINKDNFNILFGLTNEPIREKYYPADIENILFVCNNDLTTEQYNLLYNMKSKYQMINEIFDLDNLLSLNGELDTEEIINENKK